MSLWILKEGLAMFSLGLFALMMGLFLGADNIWNNQVTVSGKLLQKFCYKVVGYGICSGLITFGWALIRG